MPGLTSSEIENLIAYQIGALQAIATAAGHKVTHVKAHGAISNVACEDDMTRARRSPTRSRRSTSSLVFVVLANSKLVRAGEAANLRMAHEVFADRAYEDDGNLVSRKKPGAVLHDPKVIAERVVRMVQDGAVVSGHRQGDQDADRYRLHSWRSRPAPWRIARNVREALKQGRHYGRAVQDRALSRRSAALTRSGRRVGPLDPR